MTTIHFGGKTLQIAVGENTRAAQRAAAAAAVKAARAELSAHLASDPFDDTTALEAYANAALAVGDSTVIIGDGRYEVTDLDPLTWTRTGPDGANISAGFAQASEIIGDQVAETAAFIAAVFVAMGRRFNVRADAYTALGAGELFTSKEGGSFAVYETTAVAPYYTMISLIGYSGSILTSLLTQSTAKLLGRTTAGTGAVEELSLAGLLEFSGGALKSNIASHALFNTLATGTYVTAMIASGSLTTVAVATGTGICFPFRPAKNVTFDRLEIEVTTALAGSTFHLAIYEDNGGKPDDGAVVARTTTPIDSATTGVKDTGSQMTGTLLAGHTYWICVATSGTVTFRAPPLASLPALGAAAGAMSVASYRGAAASYAQFPATGPVTATGTVNTTVPVVRFRIA